ncbi:MAG: ParB N-terminal domain-containing protein [Candidatus Microsaccharimonas sp.]
MELFRPLYVPIEAVRVNHKKLRKLSKAKIDHYARAYERGDQFPPIVVERCGAFYVIRDGRHRFQAQLLAGVTMIEVEVY